MLSTIRRRLSRLRPARRAAMYHDPLFDDPGLVEDDYRRMNGPRDYCKSPPLTGVGCPFIGGQNLVRVGSI